MRVLQEQFLPFDLSKMMKNIGFDEPCLGYYTYDPTGRFQSEFYFNKPNVDSHWNPYCKNSLHPIELETNSPRISSPLWQQAFDWLNTKFNLSEPKVFTSINDINHDMISKMIKEARNIIRTTPPYVSDDFQIGPDGAFEADN